MKEEDKINKLLKGWKWVIYEDYSGHLQSPTKIRYFSFDWLTYEYQIRDNDHYSYFGNIDEFGNKLTFNDFKRYAEHYAIKNLINLPENQRTIIEDEEEFED